MPQNEILLYLQENNELELIDFLDLHGLGLSRSRSKCLFDLETHSKSSIQDASSCSLCLLSKEHKDSIFFKGLDTSHIHIGGVLISD